MSPNSDNNWFIRELLSISLLSRKVRSSGLKPIPKNPLPGIIYRAGLNFGSKVKTSPKVFLGKKKVNYLITNILFYKQYFRLQ